MFQVLAEPDGEIPSKAGIPTMGEEALVVWSTTGGSLVKVLRALCRCASVTAWHTADGVLRRRSPYLTGDSDSGFSGIWGRDQR